MLSLDEFSEHLRKRNMDLYFPRDEQRLLFESLDKTHSMRLPVADIIRQSQVDALEAAEQLDNFQSELKDLIMHKIDDQRGREKLVSSPRQTKHQLVRTLRNLDPQSTGYISREKLEYALSDRYLGLNLSEEEMRAAVDLCPPSGRTGEISYDKFVRLLNIRNSDAITDPFFDAKAAGITRLKARIQQLSDLENDPALKERREELLKICMIGPGPSGISKYLDPERRDPIPQIPADSSGPVRALVEQEQGMSGATSPAISANRGFHSGHDDGYRAYVDTTGDRYEDYEDYDNDHFRPTVNHPSRTKVKYPMTVDLATAHGEHKESIPGGRRRGPGHTTNWGLIRHDEPHTFGSQTLSGSVSSPALLGSRAHTASNLTLGSSASSIRLTDSRSRYTSTHAEHYTPLEYKPSMPVTRPGVIGDAMQAAMDREERRRRRYARTQANMKAVNDLVELERISQQLNESTRQKGRVIEALQYANTSFSKDTAIHRRKPGGTYMQKKGNPELFQKMWSGNLGSEKATIEDRDFNTTYGRSFVFPNSASSTIESGTGISTEAFPLGA
ncbi:unnamed protein product [Symbiodinium microadriaticum]|nr:unnamed protein product [Symbiodinium microadriaticum]